MRSLALSLLLCTSLVTVATAHELPRVEAYRLDLDAHAIKAARAGTARALASQIYSLDLPAFMNMAQLYSYCQARLAIAPKEEPLGGWLLLRDLATPSITTAMPNVDTLYGAAYLRLDLQGPVVLSLPAVSGRYVSVAILDAYFSDVAVFGPRNIGGRATNILIAPPGWESAPPKGIDRVVVMPTPVAAVFQRVYVRNAADLPAARAIQDTIRLAPLDRWREPNRAFPHVSMTILDGAKLHALRDPLRFFQLMSDYTALNPPPQAYRALIAMANTVGLGPGGRLPADSTLRAAIVAGAEDAQAAINAGASFGPFRDGWRVPDPNTGRLGLDPLRHAVQQITQVGSLPAKEAMYFVAVRDQSGALLNGAHRYSLTFPPNGLPPVRKGGFWSLTMYHADSGRLVDNPINRYVIRPDTPGLTRSPDGSLTITLAAKRPTDTPEGNWLPAPDGDFVVTLRTYLPEVAIRNGVWFPPVVIKTE